MELPYEGEQSSLLIVLPNEVDGITALVDKLKDPTALKKASENMFTNEVVVELPKFKVETTTDLGDVLQKVSTETYVLETDGSLYKIGQLLIQN